MVVASATPALMAALSTADETASVAMLDSTMMRPRAEVAAAGNLGELRETATMRVLQPSEYRRMPWKNGGGETAEIAVGPAGASLNGFGWRVSMAWVAQDGPFSSFPEVDRTLVVLEGDGIELSVEGEDAVTLTRLSQPHGFAADTPTRGRLLGGPIIDLNIMTRRGHFTHRIQHISIVASTELVADWETNLLFVNGDCGIAWSGKSFALARFSALVDLPKTSLLRFASDEPADVFLIGIDPVVP